MKINFVIFLITVFLIANTYYDGKFTDYLIKGKKYYKMATFAFVGLSIYLFINKNPNESKNLVKHATELIRYMPVDSNTSDMLTPLFDFTNARDKLNQLGQSNINVTMAPQTKRMLNSGGTAKRCVSETKKKYVAAKQLADGYPDPETGNCTALSSSYTIEAIPAFVIKPSSEKPKQSASPRKLDVTEFAANDG